MGRDERACPVCGRFFSAVRCPRCGYSGPAGKFAAGCPVCGYSMSPDDASDALEPASRTRRAGPAAPLPAWVWLLALGLLAAAVAALWSIL